MQRVPQRFGLAVTLVGILLMGIPGYAQTPNQPPNTQAPNLQDDRRLPAATRTVNLTLEQRHTIRELVKELKVEPGKEDLKVAAGDRLPAQVALQPVPPLLAEKVPSIKSHSLYVTQSQVLIVDPQEKRVVEVIE